MGGFFERKINKTDIKFSIYIFISFLFLIFVGIAAVKGDIDFDFFADSDTYMEFAEEGFTMRQVLVISPNMIGPTIILNVLFKNYFLVFFFNILILILMYNKISKFYNLDKRSLFFFLLISPVLFSSLIAINKEIIALLSMTFFFIYYRKRSISYLVLALIFSFLVRWQMTMFIVILTLLISNLNVFRNKRAFSLCLLLTFISLLYYLNLSKFETFNTIAEIGQESSDEGSGLFSVLIGIQNSNPLGYVLAWFPKFLFLFFGLLARFQKVFDFSDFYNNFITFWQCLVNFYLFILIIKKRISLSNIFFFSAIVYSMIFSLSPIFSPRYLFPVYILMAFALSSEKANQSLNFSRRILIKL